MPLHVAVTYCFIILSHSKMRFTAKINIIGINPYVLLPAAVLKEIFKQAGKDKGPIPVRGKLNNHSFIQTLVKYSGKWRLYLNSPMRRGANADVGDTIKVDIEFDAKERTITMHPKLEDALNKNTMAKLAYEKLRASRQKEITRYLNSLKTEESVDRNIKRALAFLTGGDSFAGRDKL